MSKEENKAIARRFVEGVNQNKIAIWDEVCASSCVFHDPPPDESTLEDYKAAVSGGG